MSEKPISDRCAAACSRTWLSARFGEKTKHDYIRHIESFAKFLGRSPDTATAEDVRRFQVHLTESGVRPPTLNSSASALRFFFGTTLDRAELARHLARVHYPRTLPRVLSPEEVGRLLEAAPGPGPEVQGGAEHRLWRRLEGRRGRDAARQRYRLQAHADPRRAGQGPQGPACDALAAAARAAARVVAAVPLARLAVPEPRSAAADHGTAAQPRLPHGGGGSGPGHLGVSRTRCGTPSPRTCWRAASTCA